MFDYSLDSLLWMDATTEDVYNSICVPLIDSLVCGQNGFYLSLYVILASLVSYGYTASGMTYSLFGDDTSSGIVFLLVYELLKQKVWFCGVNVK